MLISKLIEMHRSFKANKGTPTATRQEQVLNRFAREFPGWDCEDVTAEDFMSFLMDKKWSVSTRVLSTRIVRMLDAWGREHGGGILEPLKSRFDAGIEHLSAELDPWCKWALTHKVPVWIVAYARFRPEVITDWEPSADLVNSICPRTLAFVGEAVNDSLPEDMWQQAFSGMVGVGRAAELLSFYKYHKAIPNPDAIILNPDKEIIPQQPEIQYALAAALANKSKEANFDAVIRYFDRWFEGGNFKDGIPRSEFVPSYFKDAIVRTPGLKNTQAYVNWFLKHSDVYI